MKHTTKTIAKAALIAVAIVAFLIMVSETESHQFLWTFGSIAALVLAGKGLDKLGCFDK